MKITHLVLDVDGVLNTGHFFYDAQGKAFKAFGPHDKDGLKIADRYDVQIMFITADVTGWKITHARIVKDWGFKDTQLQLVSVEDRMEWFQDNYNLNTTAYIADGYHDAPILRAVKLGIAPKSARKEAIAAADYVTDSPAGSGAVLDACLFVEAMINDRPFSV